MAALKPARGKVLVKPVETLPTLGGGRIILPESTRGHWAMGQYEIVEVGMPAWCEDEDCLHAGLEHSHPFPLEAGAWVLARPRTAIDAGRDGCYFVAQADCIGVFSDY